MSVRTKSYIKRFVSDFDEYDFLQLHHLYQETDSMTSFFSLSKSFLDLKSAQAIEL